MALEIRKRIPLHIHGNLYENLKNIVVESDLKSVSWLINDIVINAEIPVIKPRKRKDLTLEMKNIKKLKQIAEDSFNGNLSEAANYLISEYLRNN